MIRWDSEIRAGHHVYRHRAWTSLSTWPARAVGEASGRLIELIAEHAPEPPYVTGRPEYVDGPTLAMARQLMASEFSEAVVDKAAQRLATWTRGNAPLPA